MKSLTFTRGVAVSVALSLLTASPALALAHPHHRPPALALAHPHHRPPALVSVQVLAKQTGESTPLHLGGGSTTAHTASTNTSASVIRTLVALLVVIAVIYGLAWILKQFRKGRSRATGRGLEQVASLPLGNGRAVSLVRVGNELLLVGVAEQSVTAIRRYSEAEAREAGLRIDAADGAIDGEAEFIEVAGEQRALSMPVAARPSRPQLGFGKQPLLESLRAMTVRH